VLVHIGDTVLPGQHLGKVACSGNCTDPHVHLEVWDNIANIDPFSGPCHTAASMWTTPLFYDTSRLIIDVGFTPYVPNLDTLRERYLVRDTFYAGIDTTVNYWLELQGMRTGDVARVDWYTPAGILWYSYSYTIPNDWWYDYFWTYITMPAAPGTWTAKFYANSTLVSSNPFYVIAPAITTTASAGAGENDFSVAPVPASAAIHITGNSQAAEPILITDMAGAVISRYPPLTPTLSLAGMSPGIYLLRCGHVVKRIVKQ
jgi:hypothetical protein